MTPCLSLIPQGDTLPYSNPTRCPRYIIYISVLKQQLKLVHELVLKLKDKRRTY